MDCSLDVYSVIVVKAALGSGTGNNIHDVKYYIWN